MEKLENTWNTWKTTCRQLENNMEKLESHMEKWKTTFKKCKMYGNMENHVEKTKN